MCSEAIVNGVRVDTQFELAKALGCRVSELKIDDGYMDESGKETGRDPDYCLCPIDEVSTAKALGWHIRRLDYSNGNSGEMEFTK